MDPVAAMRADIATMQNFVDMFRPRHAALTALIDQYDILKGQLPARRAELYAMSDQIIAELNALIDVPVPPINMSAVPNCIKKGLKNMKNPILATIVNLIAEFQALNQTIVQLVGSLSDFFGRIIYLEFSDIKTHPLAVANQNSIQMHSFILDNLTGQRDAYCNANFPDANPDNINALLPTISYTNIANDDAIYKNISCMIRTLIMRNTHSFLRGMFFDIPIENSEFRLELAPTRVISDVSVEGVAWTVGYGGHIFAVMKYAKEQPGNFKSYNLIHELIIGFILNQIRNLTPNFMYMWAGFSCNTPTQGPPLPPAAAGRSVRHDHNFGTLCENNTSENLEPIILSEPINVFGTFNDILNNLGNAGSPQHIRWQEFINILIQIITALGIAQRSFEFVHGDLHTGNILIKRLPAPVQIPVRFAHTPNQANDIVQLITTRYIPIIIDYGRCRVNYMGNVLTAIDYAWDGERIYGGLPDSDQKLGVYMQLYDMARLMNGVHLRLSGILGANIMNHRNNAQIPDITRLYNMYVEGHPEIFTTPTVCPMGNMAINLYRAYYIDNIVPVPAGVIP